MTTLEMIRSGVFGVVTGDALGCPVQFRTREEVQALPVRGMRGHGTFDLPAGTWTDDSSLTLALLSAIADTGDIDLKYVMDNFVDWLDNGGFTPFGESFDIDWGTMRSIRDYKRRHDPRRCGRDEVTSNGNGSLMRILPACLYAHSKGLSDKDAMRLVSQVGSLTHAHIRANIACGLYYFMMQAILTGEGSLREKLRQGLTKGFRWYDENLYDCGGDLPVYARLRDLDAFAALPEKDIRSTGYVVDTLEAAVWCLVTTDTFEDALLKAVNLGYDTDTVGAVAGGLAGLSYGYDAIPPAWLDELQRKDWIDGICRRAAQALEG